MFGSSHLCMITEPGPTKEMGSKSFLDAAEVVVFDHSRSTRYLAYLDLAATCSFVEVGDVGACRFAGVGGIDYPRSLYRRTFAMDCRVWAAVVI